MKNHVITDENVELLAQILAEEDVLSCAAIAKFFRKDRFTVKNRIALIEGYLDLLDDFRQGEILRRYELEISVQRRVLRSTAV